MAPGPEPMPMRIAPPCPSRIWRPLSRSSPASDTSWRARSTTSRPKGVSSLRRPIRSNSGMPSSSSSARMLRLKAGCVMHIACADLLNEPLSASASRCLSWTNVIKRLRGMHALK